MGYKYRNGSTPDHVNSTDSTSTPTPILAARDATKVDMNPNKIGLHETETASQFGKKMGLNLDGEDELDLDSQGAVITKTVPRVIIGKKK